MTSPADPDLEYHMPKVKTELDTMLEEKAKKSAFRCRANYYEKGQKTSRYFLNIEKRNYINKTMYIVCKSDGKLTKDYAEILEEQWVFYKKLYTSNREVELN